MKNLLKISIVFFTSFLINLGLFAQHDYNKSPDVVLHYWHFNDLQDEIIGEVPADFTITGTPKILYLGYGGGYMDRVNDGTTENSVFDTDAGYALRVRNPSNLRDLYLFLPTTGYEEIILSYVVKRTTNGQTIQNIYYSTEEVVNWTLFESNISITEDYQIISLDFSEITETDDNQFFAVKIVFGGEGISGVDGNNRFDNIVLNGTPAQGTNSPPYFTDFIGFMPLLQSTNNQSIDLSSIIIDPDEDELSISAFSSDAEFVSVSISDNNLVLSPNKCGEVNITIMANDGINLGIQQTFRVLVYPEAHNLGDGNFNFSEWSNAGIDYEYPDNMIFLQSDVEDPGLDYELLFPYYIPHNDYNEDDFGTIGYPYNNTRRSRINGLGADGISFINTGRDRDLGGALVAINTEGIDAATVNWTGGTEALNDRVYGIRLMYRIGIEGEFQNIYQNSIPVEYLAMYNGHYMLFENIELPEEAMNQEYVQLLWKYYWHSGTSGPRAELRLDDILIKEGSSSVFDLHNNINISMYPNPATDIIFLDTDEIICAEIFDVSGKLLIASQEKQIDISALSPGFYPILIKDINNNIISSKKLIVQ
jgi:hypothetical protein